MSSVISFSHDLDVNTDAANTIDEPQTWEGWNDNSSIIEGTVRNHEATDGSNISIESDQESIFDTIEGSDSDSSSEDCECDTSGNGEDWETTDTSETDNSTDDSWDDPVVYTDDSWQSQDDKLALQKRSHSSIAARLADLGILLEHGMDHELARLENDFFQNLAVKRAAEQRKRRHERTILIDTEDKLRALLDRLVRLDHTQPQVVIDCEGLNFKRTGTIDIMEVFVQPDDMLYLLDVVALKTKAWSTTATSSTFCMRELLESSSAKKIMWDLRMDAHILNSLYGIRLAGIVDASLWDAGYRRRVQRGDSFRMSVERACDVYLHNLVDPLERESLREAKEARFGLPPRPWAIRPLPTTLIDYTADVKYMSMIFEVLRRKMQNDPNIVAEIEYVTEQELEIACSPFWDAEGDREATSPWSDSKYFETARQILVWRKEELESRMEEIEPPMEEPEPIQEEHDLVQEEHEMVRQECVSYEQYEAGQSATHTYSSHSTPEEEYQPVQEDYEMIQQDHVSYEQYEGYQSTSHPHFSHLALEVQRTHTRFCSIDEAPTPNLVQYPDPVDYRVAHEWSAMSSAVQTPDLVDHRVAQGWSAMSLEARYPHPTDYRVALKWIAMSSEESGPSRENGANGTVYYF